MATTFKWLPYNTADTPTWSPSLASLANAAYSLSSEIDNSTGLYQFGDLTMAFGASVSTLGTPAYLSVYLLPNVDGNYTIASAQAVGSSYLAATGQAVGGGSVQYLQVRGLVLTPNKFKLLVQNNLGQAFHSTATVSLYRYGEQGV